MIAARSSSSVSYAERENHGAAPTTVIGSPSGGADFRSAPGLNQGPAKASTDTIANLLERGRNLADRGRDRDRHVMLVSVTRTETAENPNPHGVGGRRRDHPLPFLTEAVLLASRRAE